MREIVQSVEQIFDEYRNGTYEPFDAAVLITRDMATGILTFSFHGCDNEEGAELLKDAFAVRGIHQ